MPRKALTAPFVEKVKPTPGKRVDYWDTYLPAFGLRVSEHGVKTFVCMVRIHGSKVRLNLGRHPAVKVAEARDKARGKMEAASAGKDPRDEAEQERANEGPQKIDTFQAAVEDYITRYAKGERGNATADDVKAVLLRFAKVEALEMKRLRLKAAGQETQKAKGWLDRPVNEITAREIRRLLESIRDGFPNADGVPTQKPRPYLANRLHAYLSTFFRWCAEIGVDKVEASPMVGLRRPWDGEEERDRVFSNDEMKALWKAADTLGTYRGAFLKVLLLIGKRKSILAAMRHDEIADDGLWMPPQDNRRRRGNKRNHAVPLPPLALRIIRGLPKVEDGDGEANPYVFVGRHKGGHLHPGTALKNDIKEKTGIGDFFFHACRHTVETRLAELEIPPHIRDIVLDHVPMRGSGAGYDHHHYRKEMLAALTAWQVEIERVVHGAKNVVALHG